MPDASLYSEPLHALILKGTDADGKPTVYNRQQRIAAAWAIGHDLAAGKYGDDAGLGYFGPEQGPALMKQLQEAPGDATAGELLEIVKKGIGIEEEAKEAEATEAHE